MSIKTMPESEVSGHLPEAITNGRWYLWCPGCYEASKLANPDKPDWWILDALHCFGIDIHQFNGDREKPTLSPSLLVTGERRRCHSFVRDGKIQFLGDCTHPLAGQTVDLMDAPPPS